MEEKKVQLVFEFDRSEYDAFLFLMDQKKDEETERFWEAMSKTPVKCDFSVFEKDAKTAKFLMICAAVASVKELVKGE